MVLRSYACARGRDGPRDVSRRHGREPKAEGAEQSRSEAPQSTSSKQIWLPRRQIIMRSRRVAAGNDRVRVHVRCCWRAGLRQRRSTAGIMGKAALDPRPVSRNLAINLHTKPARSPRILGPPALPLCVHHSTLLAPRDRRINDIDHDINVPAGAMHNTTAR